MVMPLVHVRFDGGGIGVEQMAPLYAPRRAGPIPATAPGTYGQVTVAGNGRY